MVAPSPQQLVSSQDSKQEVDKKESELQRLEQNQLKKNSISFIGDSLAAEEFRRQQNENKLQREFRVYSSRWLMLLAITMPMVACGLERCIFSVSDTLYDHLGTNAEDVMSVMPVSLFVLIAGTMPFSSALNKYGLKPLIYMCAIFSMTAHCFLAASIFPEEHWLSIPKNMRFISFTIGNIGVQMVVSATAGFAALLACTWFPQNERSRVVTIFTCGYSLTAGVVNHFMPLFVTEKPHLVILSYIYLITGALTCLTTFGIVRRSKPKFPPTPEEEVSESKDCDQLSFKNSVKMMFSCPHFLLAMFTLSINQGNIAIMIGIILTVMKPIGYSSHLCGDLLSGLYIFGLPASFLTATLIDRSGRCLGLSRIASAIQSITFTLFSLLIQTSSHQGMIIFSDVILAITNGMLVQSMYQVILRYFKGVVPESTVMASTIVFYGFCYSVMSSLFKPLTRLGSEGSEHDNYTLALNTYAIINVAIDISFLVFFKMPDKEFIMRKLANLEKAEVLPIKDSYRFIDADSAGTVIVTTTTTTTTKTVTKDDPKKSILSKLSA